MRASEVLEYSITSQCNVHSSYHGGLHGAPRDWVLKGLCEISGVPLTSFTCVSDKFHVYFV